VLRDDGRADLAVAGRRFDVSGVELQRGEG
jgi:hypothetical protein